MLKYRKLLYRTAGKRMSKKRMPVCNGEDRVKKNNLIRKNANLDNGDVIYNTELVLFWIIY
jgi:hypothetical protein